MEVIFVMWTTMAMFSCSQGICTHAVGPIFSSRHACETAQTALVWTGPVENRYCAPALPLPARVCHDPFSCEPGNLYCPRSD